VPARPATSTALPPPPASAAESGRSRLGPWIVLILGVWLGRAFQLLPAGIEAPAGVVLALASAVLLAVAYRRWARAQMERARLRRASRADER
jgi:uncharacterized membrane protein